jgi:hypothetical protein
MAFQRWLHAGFSLQNLRASPGRLSVTFMVDEVVQEQISMEYTLLWIYYTILWIILILFVMVPRGVW